jgi:hypothetical protein
MKLSRISLLVLLPALCLGAVYASFQALQPAATPLSAYAPQGALLAIESPDFNALLSSWTSSAEQKRWLASDNYAGFSRSRLFGRLGEAQDQFAATAGLPPDARFLQQIAGHQSFLALYDIGNLEFLYITRMPPGEAAKLPLFQLRGKFEERKAGDSTFFVRTQGEPARTVAFAAHADYLLLATREDLLANALELMQQPGERTLQSESWYANSFAAAAKQPGDLRMTLNLTRIVRSPYFRTYWIQQNITELKQYTAALSDLYRTTDSFREERVLLPGNPSNAPASADLSPVLDYLPPNSGVYRAQVQPGTAEVLDELEDKLLSRSLSPYRDSHVAPVAELATPVTGSASNLEEFIDEPLAVTPLRATALAPLRNLLDASSPSAMLVFSSVDTNTSQSNEQVFSPIHTAMVIAIASNWKDADLQQAITQAIAPQVTIAQQGLAWKQHRTADATWYDLDGQQHLSLAVQGKVCVLASDQTTLLQLLAASRSSSHAPRIAATIAGFNHPSQRGPFLHITGLLDKFGRSTQPAGDNVPPFFSANMASLSNTFQDLESETFTESWTADHVAHQTVLYQWHR